LQNKERVISINEVKHLVINGQDVIEDEFYNKLEVDEVEHIQWVIEQLEKYEFSNLLSNTDYVAALKGGYDNLWYLRKNYRTNTYRIFFTNTEKIHVLLYGIRKKTQKIPQKDIDIALKRKNIVFEELV